MSTPPPSASIPTTTPRSPSANRAKTVYLIGYNFVSAVLWLAVLGRVALITPLAGTQVVYRGTGDFAKWTQTLAGLEVLHSVFGIVRAPFLTTAMQVASRFLLVWVIANNFPGTTSSSPAYASMLLAWSATEVVRYSYFVGFLAGEVPSWLSWLRYNTFYILYPLGISSEMWLVYRAIAPALRQNPLYGYALWAILAVYIPGSYVLFTHMMAQRRRIIRGKQRGKAQ